ncbi:hypothetical protein OG613_47405 (plasmid) [Streptomyces sp. NBC_00015]|uniref:hypothetical protein n=1 Tax=Streptomyces sp. NBC_00015 TaxID=2903611 RepID=UPI002F9079D0
MTTPDLNAGELPRLTRTRPDPQHTVRELFGHDGQFFTVPDSFPGGLPDHITFAAVAYYAVLRAPNLDTGEDEFTVRDVDGRRTIGEPAPEQDTSIRSALSALAERRRAHAQQVEHNRVHVLGLDPVPPVRIGHTITGTCTVHIRCSCPQVEGLAAHYENVPLAAADWLDANPATTWELCPTSPARVITPSVSGRISATFRNADGAAGVEIQHLNGHREVVALTRASDLA